MALGKKFPWHLSLLEVGCQVFHSNSFIIGVIYRRQLSSNELSSWDGKLNADAKRKLRVSVRQC